MQISLFSKEQKLFLENIQPLTSFLEMLEALEGISFFDAVKLLSEKAGIPLEMIMILNDQPRLPRNKNCSI